MIADDFQRLLPAVRRDRRPGGAHGGVEARRARPTTRSPTYLADIFTLPASLAGLPGMSLPAGHGDGGLPVGLQLIGNYFQEGTLLHAAHAFQQATGLARPHPDRTSSAWPQRPNSSAATRS